MEREKRLSILYQKQGRATQFANKAARDKWLQKEIDEYKRALSTNLAQVKFLFVRLYAVNLNGLCFFFFGGGVGIHTVINYKLRKYFP